MKVLINKSVTIVVDIPDSRIKDYFGHLNELEFISWADQNMTLDTPEIDIDSDRDDAIESWVNNETTESIEIEDCPKELKPNYSKKEINDFIEERDRIERCYECSGYGDDYYYDESTGELESSCTNCPFNSNNYD